jgi:hypothetical protein
VGRGGCRTRKVKEGQEGELDIERERNKERKEIRLFTHIHCGKWIPMLVPPAGMMLDLGKNQIWSLPDFWRARVSAYSLSSVLWSWRPLALSDRA